MTISKNIKPRVSKSEREQKREDCMARIMQSHHVNSAEAFTVADISSWLGGVDDSVTRNYLNDLADAGKLNRREVKSGKVVYTRKPTAILKRAWRYLSNSEIGIEPLNRLGMPV
jgi:hypothetical protein